MFKKMLKKLIFIIITCIILVCSVIISPSEIYANENEQGDNNRKYSDSTIIVKYKENVSELMQFYTNALNESQEETQIGSEKDNIKVLKIKKGQTVEQALEKYVTDPNVEYAEPDYLCELSKEPNDPYYRNQSNVMNMLNIPKAWDYATGNNNIIVAVVDSGVNYNHADLAGRVILGYDFGENKSDPMDNIGHGTNVAGVIAANTNNGLGVAGITWQGKVMAIKVSNVVGAIPVSAVANGIRYAADNGAHVINLSLGTKGNSATMKDAIDYAYNKGCIIVAASGNEGNTINPGVNYPAAYPNVIGVGGTTDGVARYVNSCYGTGLDVIAVYTHYTTSMSGGYASVAGTSFSSPQVASLAALLLGVNSSITNIQARQYIVDGTTDLRSKGWDNDTGYGLVSFSKSIENLITDMDNEPKKVAEVVSKLYVIETAQGINYITNMTEEMKVQSLIQKLGLSTSYKIDVTDISGMRLTSDKNFGTGSTVRISSQKDETLQSYKVVVKGDITGDGTVNLYDIVKIIKYVYDPEQSYTWNESVRRAGKVTSASGIPGLFDIQRIINYSFNGVKW